MKVLIIDSGIIYNKKLIPWEVFYDVVTLLGDNKLVERLKKVQRDRIKFDEIIRGQETDYKYFHELGTCLGIKPSQNLNRLKKQIDTRIKKLNFTTP